MLLTFSLVPVRPVVRAVLGPETAPVGPTRPVAAAPTRHAPVGLSVATLATDVAIGLAYTALAGGVPILRRPPSAFLSTAMGRSGAPSLSIPATQANARAGPTLAAVEAPAIGAAAVAVLVPVPNAAALLRGAETSGPATGAIGPTSGGAAAIATNALGASA